MKIAILREWRAHETRVAATPETVKKLVALGLDVYVEQGAGAGSCFSDSAYTQAGAIITPSFEAALNDAGIVLSVQRPAVEKIAHIKPGAVLIGMLSPHQDRSCIEALAARKIDAFAMELMPRITRAQTMDVLSSQSNLAGYRAVIEACNFFPRAMPMMMTAAGTIAPGRVMVMGTGVAGLQAIATARRLGAIVCATDVRFAAKEQVESLGAKFVMVETAVADSFETKAGYAKEMSEDYKRQQALLIASTLSKQDIVICTALIPGRMAPVLITAEMVRSMKPGSVIVDIAVEQGGNCALSKPDEVVDVNGVKIIGYTNMPGRLPVDASMLYSSNLFSFLTPMIAEGGELAIDWQDEIITGTALTHAGRIVHPSLHARTE